MARAKTLEYLASNRERGLLALAAIIMTGTMPFTYVFFLIPLLNLPIALLALLVSTKVIRNKIAVRVIEVLAVLGTLFAIWLAAVLQNYLES